MSQLAATSGAEQADARHRLGVRRATLLAASLAFFIVPLDTSIVNLALVRMQDALGTNLAGLQWVVDLYALVFTSFLLTGGALADKFRTQQQSQAKFFNTTDPKATLAISRISK